jgi:hypothetical protein
MSLLGLPCTSRLSQARRSTLFMHDKQFTRSPSVIRLQSSLFPCGPHPQPEGQEEVAAELQQLVWELPPQFRAWSGSVTVQNKAFGLLLRRFTPLREPPKSTFIGQNACYVLLCSGPRQNASERDEQLDQVEDVELSIAVFPSTHKRHVLIPDPTHTHITTAKAMPPASTNR